VNANLRLASIGREIVKLVPEASPLFVTEVGQEVRPVRRGIHRVLMKMAPGGVISRNVAVLIGTYFSRTRYRRAVAAPGSMRHHLNLVQGDPVSEKHRRIARRYVAEKDAAFAER